MYKYLKIFTLLVGIISIGSSFAQSEKLIWQIGEFDSNFNEFALTENIGRYNELFPAGVNFHPATDNVKTGWPYIHPGNVDAWAGQKIHPVSVIFDLAGKPQGLFKLKISVISAHSSFPPKLRIDANGISDAIQMQAGSGDAVLGDASKGKPHDIELMLDSGYFKQGKNKIVFTCEDGSWILYDALSLTNYPDRSNNDSSVNDFAVNLTNCFVKRSGKLKQIVEFRASISSASSDCVLKYQIGSEQKEVKIKPGLLGSVSADIEIDEVIESVPISAVLTSRQISKTVSAEVKPLKKWKVYVLPTVHVDVGYTDIQPNVIDLHNKNTDNVLELLRDYPDFKWNMETAWAQENYLAMASDEKRAEFIKYAKEGRLGCQVVYGNMLSGILSHEEQIRSLFTAKNLSNKYGIPFNMAVSSDVPTQVWTLPTSLAASGIKYFASGINLTRGESFAKMLNKSPFYWEGPDGSRVMSWLASGYGQAQMLGLTNNLTAAKRNINNFIAGFNRDDYPYDAVFAFGGFSDNQGIDVNLAKVVSDWNKKYEYPKVILCTGSEFFRYIEDNYNDSIPVIRGDGGVYWEDGAGSSAYETAITRVAKEDLNTADKLFSLISMNYNTRYPADDFSRIWKDILMYDEHTWGAAGSISDPESFQTRRQWAYKRAFALRSYKDTEALLNKALNIFADSVDTGSGSILVFNPHSQPSDGIVKMSDGRSFWADDVPPLGYKTFPASSAKPVASVSLITKYDIENKYYKIVVDPATGVIRSIFDKELNRELVDQSADQGANQYMYVTGHGALAIDSAKIANVDVKAGSNVFGQTLTIASSAFNTPSVKTVITLYDNMKRIDFDNAIEKTETYDKEAGYFAFPFDVNDPIFDISLPNGTVSPNKDMLPGACMTWYAMQDFTAIHNDDIAIVWSALDSPLLTIGDINRDSFISPQPITNGRLYAYIFNNYWFTNYKASQGGTLKFRFAITSMKNYDRSEAYRFGQSFRNPMPAVEIKRSDNKSKAAYDSFLSGKPYNVIIQSIKKAESGDGFVIKLLKTNDRTTSAEISLPRYVKKAWSCNQLEEIISPLDINSGSVKVDMSSGNLAAILIK